MEDALTPLNLSKNSCFTEPELTPTLIGILWNLQASITSFIFQGAPIFPGLSLIASDSFSQAASASL